MYVFIVTRSPRGDFRNVSDNGVLGNFGRLRPVLDPKSAIQLLQTVDAPLTFVIAGNHDFTMDIPVFKKKVAEYPHPDTEKVFAAYGNYGQARELFSGTGITFLDEGTHSFSLDNGAVLTVYASPYTPSLGDWGFQYHPDYGHDFTLLTGDGLGDIDVVITHGPPRGILDYTNSRDRRGVRISLMR